MTETMLLELAIRLMIGNEDEIRALLPEVDTMDLYHVRNALKGAMDRASREIISRGWDELTGVTP